MPVIEENELSIEDNMKDENDDGKITKTKVKKPRTEAQMIAFKEVMKKRAENIEIKKHEKLIKASQILVNNSKTTVKQGSKDFMKQTKTPIYESSSDEEIIIVKAKPKKKKVKKIIIEDSSSASSGSDGGGKNKYKEQISIQRETPKPVFNSNHYFI